MDNREYITTLYEIYKELLNEKERINIANELLSLVK